MRNHPVNDPSFFNRMRSQFIAEKRKLNEEINDLESSRATMQVMKE